MVSITAWELLAVVAAYIQVACPQELIRIPTNTSKAGLGWPNGNSVDITQFESTQKVSWYYTWSPFSSITDLEFVPMLWGQDQVAAFTSSIYQTIASGNVHAVLGMNEPDQPTQSNLTPQQAAQMWISYLEPLRSQGVQLGSPAISSAPYGFSWLQTFLSTCAGNCSLDFIVLHWYGVNATEFQLYLQNFYNTFQRPLWVTEWACQNYVNVTDQCSPEEIVLFMNQTQGFMDATSWVERYAWYGAMKNLNGLNPDNALMDQNGNITPLGKQYIGSGSVALPTNSCLPAHPLEYITSIASTLVAMLLLGYISYTIH